MPTSDEDFVDNHGAHTSSGAGADGNSGSPDRVRAVPAARALAKRLGIDLANIRGTGRGALVTVDDVLHMTKDGGAHPTHLPNAAPAREGERLRGPRRAMAHSMAVSRDNVMGCTLFDDADLHSWLHPENHQQGDEPQKPDITTRVLRAIAEGCAAEPALNSWFDGEALTRRVLTQIDVAIAVDTPEGLIVPVVRNIAGRPVAELRREVDRLKRDTRERTVKPEDLRDFTFMLSNFGMIAGRYATPVVVPPAVAILGCGRLSHDVIATQSGSSSAKTSSQHYPSGNIEAHLRMPLSLTFDHRCVTGGEAARFLAAVIRDLQKGN
jgi:pyruvate dehydrogenase E2 component (dihydrolipoamide acetyltransferase)